MEPLDEDTPPRRPVWLGVAIAIFTLMIVGGLVSISLRIMRIDTPVTVPVPAAPVEQAAPAAPPAPPAPATPAQQAARQALQSRGDCMRCHGINDQRVGPSFVRIAERYREQADASDYLAGKIVAGSVGAWGRLIMPRQPQISPELSQSLAQAVLALASQPQAPADTQAN